ncbi:hypothetical protein AVEN_148983-1 [Araneus ventricosus]|uniref:Reverse transcriptase domain-containing protein n=1 Tax=Araneus ventricosus TaxID=182803 RepID=A0A4Y2V5U2_ARAVE|nr:hypothetical protein AVEN_148983-1 [Araneus ventricosus]
MILKRLTFYLNSQDLLPKEQYGFREGNSTTDQVLYFCQNTRDAQNKRPTNHTVSVFLDLTKAFDKVWNQNIIIKLYEVFGISGRALTWIYAFLRNRLIRVNFKNSLSRNFKLSLGVPQSSVRSPILFSLFLSDIEQVTNGMRKIGSFADDIFLWRSGIDLKKLESGVNQALVDFWNIAEDHKIKYGYPIYCCASNTNLQRLERVQLSAARIITGLRNSCPKDIVLYEANLQPLNLRRIPNLVKYYNKLYSLDSRNRTSAYLKDWCDNQRLKRNSPFSQVTSCNLITNTVEQHQLTQSIDPSVGLPGVFFHTNLPVHVNKQKDHLTYLRQLALEIINDIPVDAVKVYTDGSKNDGDCTGSGIYIKTHN